MYTTRVFGCDMSDCPQWQHKCAKHLSPTVASTLPASNCLPLAFEVPSKVAICFRAPGARGATEMGMWIALATRDSWRSGHMLAGMGEKVFRNFSPDANALAKRKVIHVRNSFLINHISVAHSSGSYYKLGITFRNRANRRRTNSPKFSALCNDRSAELFKQSEISCEKLLNILAECRNLFAFWWANQLFAYLQCYQNGFAIRV